jgi:hypothetical protein
MPHFHINESNIDEMTEQLNEVIADNNNQIFILYYMEGCGPCNATRPEWSKIENILKSKGKDKSTTYVVDIDQRFSSKIKGQKEPSSFPTMRFITNGGELVENYEDSSISKKDRTIDSFIEWIDSKTKSGGGRKNKRKYKRTNKSHHKRKHRQTIRRRKSAKRYYTLEDLHP